MIDAGRKRPAFFLQLAARKGEMQLMGNLLAQLAAQLSSSQLFQLFMILLAQEGRGETGREDRKRGGGRRGWKKMENYLLNK